MLAGPLSINDIALHELDRLSETQREQLLARVESDLSHFVAGAAPIIEAVARDGDAALVRFAREFDKADITGSGVEARRADFDEAFSMLDREMIGTLEYAADNIRRYHEAQLPAEIWMKEIKPGVLVGERYTPVDSVALYSPRGKGSFPSATLMTAIPATVARVPMPIILTPVGPDGKIDAATLVAARLAGIERVYKAGGAVAVAAAAFGTQTVPRCCKFEGPGSPWVAAAKHLLHGKIGSRVSAGPSESIVMADATADPRLAALDLLIESEHGSDSSAFLITWSREIAEAARAVIPEFWKEMGMRRVEYSRDVLSGARGGIVLTRDRQQAYDFINDYAPEHLQIHSKTPFEHLGHIRNAAEILLGEHAPGSIANYLMGPNAVLPTGGAARYGSGLSVHDFQKATSIGHITAAGYAEMAPHAHRFASYEGFDAHANAVSPLRERAPLKADMPT
ncbi:histidinol dehydrogenase [Mesorhizobium sp.]|uniref:histidinol dehydrogenase n=1 Tax=Mesorhizobium sp. TaxID=1871066 RepID=UPI000FE510EA|nr:histidinol dehydrogenase [Mesorhizobium sp.]RWC33526.1 MAG: histidinol dehydrogenase [Mesorhizobium sp.]RWC50497.1 MAG: histidinol dehydrogenase [Mesorhizobium sp.]RWC62392.1 MAG: histidinol dehydrogenase [Mesorhizobium sp.]RWC65699.1 MAG: histidinol dehydrogenase [Mesorhizobium sp.]TIX28349.1 MAG: histidinol dehydrogenase [Mesorhizobium sp.]